MNQATNLIQWKNLTEEQQDQFDFENFTYEFQNDKNGWFTQSGIGPSSMNVYRLKILPDEWYYHEYGDRVSGTLSPGANIDVDEPYSILRPATPSEIPKPEPTLEERVKAEYPEHDVVMFDRKQKDGILGYSPFGFTGHTHAQSMRGFAGYIYEHLNKSLTWSLKPTKGNECKVHIPVAAIFTRGDDSE